MEIYGLISISFINLGNLALHPSILMVLMNYNYYIKYNNSIVIIFKKSYFLEVYMETQKKWYNMWNLL